ncbi:MAG: hypothetical protein D6790_19205 [Caldilineae bacterium]|nr:MAG: hypothetical protein D6790_19205 [Caldilineae bacterium]
MKKWIEREHSKFWWMVCGVAAVLAALVVSRSTPAWGEEAPPPALRIGYDVDVSAGSDLTSSVVRSLGTGGVMDWTARRTPPTPAGVEYVQTVRVHQALTCPLWSENAWNRDACPYVEPHSYLTRPSITEVAAIAAANPGALWLIGNEMDRRDWHLGGQDEMLPELYATAYHDLYTTIKNADPTAQVAIGGVIQATPLRLQYLTRVWDAYRAQYGTDMPVDVWNMHNFILREVWNDYGADIPPGIPHTTTDGRVYSSDWTHIDMSIFDEQIRAFRGWMAERGQQEKPLIVSEYGVLYSHCAEWHWNGSDWECRKDFNDQQVVIDFMLATFDYFLNARDCSIGYVADGCRLVQRWFWFSLDHGSTFNPHASLYDPKSNQLTPAGAAFRDWVAAHRADLSLPIPTDDRPRVHLPTIYR